MTLDDPTKARVEGHVEPGWQKVADAFAANFDERGEVGASCCVYAEGRPVVDLWGGVADRRTGRRWLEDTVALVFSTTKGATAICAHMLVERGDLDLDAPVAAYWPEFGTEGKEQLRVRWLLSHQAGLPVIDRSLTLEEACAWDPVIRALESQKPLWTPGKQHLYHALTYGFLVGELVRRVTDKSLGRFFSDEIAGPLELNSWIGLPEEVEPRVAHLDAEAPQTDIGARLAALATQMGAEPTAALEAAEKWQTMLGDPTSVVRRISTLGGALPELITEEGGANSRVFRAAEFPAANLVTDARSAARMYAATVGEVDGVRLVAPTSVDEMCVVQTTPSQTFGIPPGTESLAEALSAPYALGFIRPSRLFPMLGASSFGHTGAGGSLAFADRDSGVAFGYVMNHMSAEVVDPRAAALVAAVSSCID
jgi:CubicO group peptidase (beta-lactamase class C family)